MEKFTLATMAVYWNLTVLFGSIDKTIGYIRKTLKDSNNIAEVDHGPEGTFNGFNFEKPVTRRIDYIFVSKNIKVNKYAVLSDNWNLQYPSDHLPVLIETKLTN